MIDVQSEARGCLETLVENTEKDELEYFMKFTKSLQYPNDEWCDMVDSLLGISGRTITASTEEDEELVYLRMFKLVLRTDLDVTRYAMLKKELQSYFEGLPITTKALICKVT